MRYNISESDTTYSVSASTDTYSVSVYGGLSQAVKNKLLFLGNYADISNSQLPNTLGSDYLTVSGDAGSETYQCPNTSAYTAADTEYLWFNGDGSQRDVTTAELIGHDFTDTLVKYVSGSPYTIQIIAIIKDGETFTEAELDEVHSYFDLSIFWSGTFSDSGVTKDNRRLERSVWTNAIVLLATNTWAWYDSQDLDTITKNESNIVSEWRDKNDSGNDLACGEEETMPVWSTDGVTGDGINDFLTTGEKILEQPEFIYALVRQDTWTAGDAIMDGGVSNTLRLNQNTETPNIRARVGDVFSDEDGNLAVGEWGIVRVLINGANSRVQVDDNDPVTVSFGDEDMNGLTLFARAVGGASWSNVTIKEMFIRTIVDSEQDETALYNYLMGKI